MAGIAIKPKPVRFLWRVGRNVLSVIPATRRILFPPEKLSASFGRGDAQYSWSVFCHHWSHLEKCGYSGARTILEIGPGRNIGTGLLWWAGEAVRHRGGSKPRVVLWDVFANAQVNSAVWSPLAADLLRNSPDSSRVPGGLLTILEKIASGTVTPHITYVVGAILRLADSDRGAPFDLIYSHAALEHIWHIEETWRAIRQITTSCGWHSHRIDLADHGSRNTNYIEMLEWSNVGYWLTTRFVPGGINRWRAFQHIDCLKRLGFDILMSDRESRDRLPVSREQLAKPFRDISELELRTTAIDLVARLHA